MFFSTVLEMLRRFRMDCCWSVYFCKCYSFFVVFTGNIPEVSIWEQGVSDKKHVYITDDVVTERRGGGGEDDDS